MIVQSKSRIMTCYGNYPDLTGVRRILIIKLRHLGDVLLTAPVFNTLRRVFPDACIDAYVYDEATPLLEGHPAIHTIFTCRREWKKMGVFQRLRKELALLWEIRQRRYDMAINLTEGDRGALATRFSRATIRVGVDSRRIYTHQVKHCSSLRHTVERHLDALLRIGIRICSEDKDIFLTVAVQARQRIIQYVAWERFLVIHAPSRWRFKCWPVEHFRLLARQLIERGEKLVFTSSSDPEEIKMVEQIMLGLPSDFVLNCAGRISLQELIALIERCHGLVCVDSVPLHIASALKKPVVAIFGPTSEVTWGPWRHPLSRIIKSDISCRPCYLDGCGGGKVAECLHAVSPQQVLFQLCDLLTAP
jgi:heptosyltransferase-3